MANSINQKETKKIKLTGKSIDIYAFADNGKMTLCDALGNTLLVQSTRINSGVDELTTADASIVLAGLAEIIN